MNEGRVDANRFTVRALGFIQQALLVQGKTKSVMGFGQSGIEHHGRPVACGCFSESLAGNRQAAQLGVQARIVEIERSGLFLDTRIASS